MWMGEGLWFGGWENFVGRRIRFWRSDLDEGNVIGGGSKGILVKV